MKICEVVFLDDAEQQACTHLLQHYDAGRIQEDLCFALWRPSTGESRYTAIIDEIILPTKGDRILHGNVEFNPQFLSKAIRLALKKKAGLAFMHSHPADGWQDMSHTDIVAERDVLFYSILATGLPLLGLTVGTDGYWSARFWNKEGKKANRRWCSKVRVVGSSRYKIYCNDTLIPAPQRKNILRRTFDTWGEEHQNNIARLKVGIVGLGSVGSIVAEAIARVGVCNTLLIDPDKVEEHNLDRLLHATIKDVGRYKVDVVAKQMHQHATAESVNIKKLPLSVHAEQAYKKALDCDILFSCVDRPVARDVLNYIAFAHLIPVIDGGIAVQIHKGEFYSAVWRAHIITPYHQCMRCNGQYTTSDVTVELDGSLDNPSYISNLPQEQRDRNQNVFPFSLGVAANEINLFVRYLIGKEWWPHVQQQEYQFLTGTARVRNETCRPHCIFQKERIAVGDASQPYYVKATIKEKEKVGLLERIKRLIFS